MKKFLTYSVVAATIAWSMGISAVLPAAAAYTPVDGDVIKATTGCPAKSDCSAVYYISGGKRFTFVNRGTYSSWSSALGDTADSFKGLKGVAYSDIGNIVSGGSINYRPGVGLIKFNTTDNVYAVTPGGKLCKLADAAAKTALYGATVPAVVQGGFEGNYDQTTPCTLTATSKYPDGTLIKSGTEYFYIEGGMKKAVGTDAFAANGFKDSWARTVSDTSAYTSGSAISGKFVSVVAGASTSVTPVGGSVSVALASDTPVSANLASGSAFNSVLKINVTAGSQAAAITGLTLNKAGYAANAAISGIDLIDATGARHGNVASSINSDNQVNLIFTSDPINVSAGQTATLTVRVNLRSGATDAGTTLQLGLASASAVTAGGTVSGSFPVWGNSMSIINASNSLGAATLDEQPVNDDATLNVDFTHAQDIAKFRVVSANNNEGLRVKGLTLYNLGNAADTDYKDVELVAADGTILATAQPKGQNVILSGFNYFIDKGQTKDFTVRAKIVGLTNRTIQFVAYNDYDLMVSGDTTGVNILATVGTTDTSFPIGNTTATYNKVTIGTGSMTFSKDPSSPNTAVAPGASSVVLAKFVAKATGEDIEMRTISLGITNSGATALTGSVYVKVNGSNVWSDSASNVTSSSGMASTTLNSYVTLKAGVDSIITVEGNVSSNATSADAYRVYLDVNTIKRLITNDIIDAGVAADSGNSININAAALKVTTLSTPVAATTVMGNDFEFLNIELNAQNSGEDVKVSKIIIADTVANGGAVTQITNLRLYQGTNPLATSNSTANASASTTFTLVNPIIVTKGTSVTLKMIANISGVSDSDDTHRFAINNGAVTATGVTTGNTLSGTSLTYAGGGQIMTLKTTGSATASLVSGTNASPSSDQLINVGTTDGIYFAFKLSASTEAMKMRTIKVSASSSALSINDLRNIRLLANGTVVATANQFDTCSGTVCSVTFTATDNIFGSTLVDTVTGVTVSVKADIGAAGIAKVGERFRFYISSSTTDLIGVGANSDSAVTITGAPYVNAYTYVSPFVVSVAGVSPTAPATVGTAAGVTVGSFRVTNNGSAPITLTKAKFTDSGASTSTHVYTLKASTDGAQTGTGASTGGVTTSTSADFTTSMTIAGGSSRLLTVQVSASDNYNTYALSANQAVGDFTFSVAESDLGYDADGDGLRTATISTLGVVGNPEVSTVTARNN